MRKNRRDKNGLNQTVRVSQNLRQALGSSIKGAKNEKEEMQRKGAYWSVTKKAKKGDVIEFQCQIRSLAEGPSSQGSGFKIDLKCNHWG